MEEKISKIKEWLGTGSINIFGLPMSGKDTQGVKLAEAIGAKLLSSGIIIRAKEAEAHKNLSGHGTLIPTDVFLEWILPYLSRQDLTTYPLILSSVGRWSGEENDIMAAAMNAKHEIKAVLLLNISEAAVEDRWTAAKTLGDRGDRKDDKDIDTFHTRLEEFRTKTLPVLQHYKELGLLININGNQPRDAVFAEIINKLYERAVKETAPTSS